MPDPIHIRPQLPLQSDIYKMSAPPNALPLRTNMARDLIRRIRQAAMKRGEMAQVAGRLPSGLASQDYRNLLAGARGDEAMLRNEMDWLKYNTQRNYGPAPQGWNWQRTLPPGSSWETPPLDTDRGYRAPGIHMSGRGSGSV